MTVTEAQAQVWLDRWDRQQQGYIADREERFAVLADVLATEHEMQRIVDLGCGPGSLAARLSVRFPQATIVGVDADPLLLGLARARHAAARRLRFVHADLRLPGWRDALGVDGPVDAVVSTTALHWLTGDELAALYRDVAALLRPGGLFVDGDHFATSSEAVDRLATAVRDGRAGRVGQHAENWQEWWTAVGQAAELAELVGERGARPIAHDVAVLPTLDDHSRLLRSSGFAEVGVVWQHGDDRILAAVR